jgi:nitroreductase
MLSVHQLLPARSSRGTFKPDLIPVDAIHRLFDAVRCSASAYNEQPWFFMVGDRRDPAQFHRVLNCFEPNNYKWAQNAPLVVITLAKTTLDWDGSQNTHAWHDVGLGVQNLTLQATHEGLFLHQAAGIHRDKVRKDFNVPDNVVPVAGLAIGYRADGDAIDDPRGRRKSLESFVFEGAWGNAYGGVVQPACCDATR